MTRCVLLLAGVFSAAAAIAAPVAATAQQPPVPDLPFRDPDLPLEERVADLLSRLTLEEKASQMLTAAPAIERLGTPAYDWWSEALHGVARAGLATVFPQAIGLAATWDTELMLRVATATSDEARAKHHHAAAEGRRGIYEGLTFFSPNINIFRDPRWGRGMETYGEDPYLTGRLAVEFVRGMQGDHPSYLKTAATVKHFAVHSGPEPDRHTFDAQASERDLRETYLPAFRASVVEGGVESIMCAYNRFRGAPACASELLLEEILRGEWGFDGYVVSDCWAIEDIYRTHRTVATAPEAAAMSLAAGTDLNCGPTFETLPEALGAGLIDEAVVDSALARLLRVRFRLGMFDPPERVPYTAIPYDVVDSEAHRALALEAARKSIVLLKNEDGLLPLSKDVRAIAVIGPNADDVETLLGNYNGIPAEPVTPLVGIRRALPPGTEVIHARGSDLVEGIPSFEVVPASALRTRIDGESVPGLEGQYFDNHEHAGPPAAVRADSIVAFNWWEAPPHAGIRPDSFSVRWHGELVPPASGSYALGVRVFGSARLFLDDSLIVEYSDRHVVVTQWADVELNAGQPRSITLEYRDRRSDASIQLVWSKPDPRRLDEAVEAAGRADVVILALGLSPRIEGEEMPVDLPGFSGGDRVDIGLPAAQIELLQAVAEVDKPMVLVLLNGSALGVEWAAERVPAIVEIWYPGQAAGTALADVLFGDYSPAGRLPVTFYGSADQLPPFDDYDMEGRTYRYFAGEPLFPFGHGLSYASFRYRGLRLPASVEAGESVEVSVEVENVGAVAAEEVVQLYVSDLEASVPVPIRSLAGFSRIALRPGETRRVSFTLTPRQLSLIDTAGRRVLEPGTFEVSVGGKQPGFTGVADAATTGVVTGRFDIAGDKLLLEPR